MSESSLTLPELRSAAEDHPFIMRLGWLGAQLARNGHEGGFTIRKPYDRVSYSNLVIPQTAGENEGHDPRLKLAVRTLLYTPKGEVDPALSLFIHSHPGDPFTYMRYAAHPSHTDLDIYRRAIYPVHPGHIGGIFTASTSLPVPYNLFLYRAGPEFDPDALQLRPGEPLTFDEAETTHAMMLAAGLRTTALMYGIDTVPMGLDNLAKLYE